jgi:regulator of replication initiation timing
MDEIKKENFDLKLRVDSLQERLSRSAPGNIESTINENVNLRVTNEALKAEIRTYKQMAEEANMAVEEAKLRARTSNGTGV